MRRAEYKVRRFKVNFFILIGFYGIRCQEISHWSMENRDRKGFFQKTEDFQRTEDRRLRTEH
ncbi:hypothetical protein LEP1GSC047_0055 [Leptospira inadai serovar Lyme str. 10]|uniref:Uncharacterized protein n=1 Tax=Leptospira inadai serovar Lyme str. 10 TaxID=1049790 RepID=V6HMY2_9LEPT|nr:hypothetical protein LEP1GSC047_0055 [Leptospira inadai serovar Lyme str. 10]